MALDTMAAGRPLRPPRREDFETGVPRISPAQLEARKDADRGHRGVTYRG